MYRLFNRIPKGLEPVAEMFRKHVEGEGMALVKEVTEASQMKKEKDAGTPVARPASFISQMREQLGWICREAGQRRLWW